MKINNKKNHLSRMLFFFIMLLFVMGLTMNVFLCSNYNLYGLLDKTAVIETWANSESIVSNEGGDDTPHFKASFLGKNNSHTETITKNICPIPMIAAIPNGFSLLLFLIIVFLFSFSAFFILLPDEWTLINQKVRLDD
ncbi:hypothetical protein [Diplocloster hominis]|uniref:hypothetical protein n=1 Tax=Diplocloster hominis TaxID=3079010 RepID=UPI0031B9AD6F